MKLNEMKWNELPHDIPESFQKAFFNRLFGVDVGIINFHAGFLFCFE